MTNDLVTKLIYDMDQELIKKYAYCLKVKRECMKIEDPDLKYYIGGKAVVPLKKEIHAIADHRKELAIKLGISPANAFVANESVLQTLDFNNIYNLGDF